MTSGIQNLFMSHRPRAGPPTNRLVGLVRIFRGYSARGARAPHISTYLGTNMVIYAQIWPYLRDLCPIFGYFVALEIELFVRARTCALILQAYLPMINLFHFLITLLLRWVVEDVLDHEVSEYVNENISLGCVTNLTQRIDEQRAYFRKKVERKRYCSPSFQVQRGILLRSTG